MYLTLSIPSWKHWPVVLAGGGEVWTQELSKRGGDVTVYMILLTLTGTAVPMLSRSL